MPDQVLFRAHKPRRPMELLDLFTVRRSDRLAQRLAQQKPQKMAIFAHDHIGNHINQFGFYEATELDLIFDFLGGVLQELNWRTALDIGANIGNHSVYFTKHFHRVHSFEPNPAPFQLLSFNVASFDNVVAHNFGLGNRAETLALNECIGNIGASSLTHKPERGGRELKIEIQRLDDLDIELTGLCLMKIDVEGFEENVIRGARNTIAAHQPVIIFEQNKSDFSDGTTPSIELLRASGYRFCWIESVSRHRHWLANRLRSLKELVTGREYRVVSGALVPPNSYSMLIGVPPRFQAALLG